MPRVSSCLRAVTAAVLISLIAILAAPAPAKAASWLEKSFFMSGANYSGQVPPCEAALGAISAQFAEKESRFWNSSLQIVSYARVREVAYNAWAPGTIPRRYCRAVALVSDGRRRPVNFWIGEDTSFVGFAAAVEWCVVGLDRNWAYNPACKMALP
jgi:hypothetical protein